MGGIRRLLILCTVASTVLLAPAARFAMASGRSPQSAAGMSRGASAPGQARHVAAAPRPAEAVDQPARLATGKSDAGTPSASSSDDANEEQDPSVCENDGDADHDDEAAPNGPCGGDDDSTTECKNDNDGDADDAVEPNGPCEPPGPTVCANDGDHDADDAVNDADAGKNDAGVKNDNAPCRPPCDQGGLAGASTETISDQLWDGGLNAAAPLLHEPEANGPLSGALDSGLAPLNPVGHEVACAVSLVDGK